MVDMITLETEIGEDGKLTIQLPPDSPRGKVEIIVREVKPEPPSRQLTPEEEAALDAELEDLLSDESLKGMGLTAEEIARSPEIGIWADREDMQDSVRYIAEMRRKSRERRLNFD